MVTDKLLEEYRNSSRKVTGRQLSDKLIESFQKRVREGARATDPVYIIHHSGAVHIIDEVYYDRILKAFVIETKSLTTEDV